MNQYSVRSTAKAKYRKKQSPDSMTKLERQADLDKLLGPRDLPIKPTDVYRWERAQYNRRRLDKVKIKDLKKEV